MSYICDGSLFKCAQSGVILFDSNILDLVRFSHLHFSGYCYYMTAKARTPASGISYTQIEEG